MCEGKLIGEKTRRPSKVKTMKFQFADDAAGGQANYGEGCSGIGEGDQGGQPWV